MLFFAALEAIAGRAAAPDAAGLAWTHANALRVERALAQGHVDRTPAGPSWTSYLGTLGRAFGRWMAGLLRRHPDFVGNALQGAEVMAWVVLGAAIVLLAMGIVRFASRRAVNVAAAPSVEQRAEETVLRRTREQWKVELERRLSSSDVRGALHALWWWLACAVAAGKVEASWTSGQVMAAAGGHDLSGELVGVDRMIYGTRRPGIDEVQVLWNRLQRAVA